MASIIVQRGRNIIVGRLSATADAFSELLSMSADDGAAFTDADTNLGSPANLVANDFDATPTRSGDTTSHVATFGTGEANFAITRFGLHNAAAASVGGATDTLFGGIDGQSITKTSDFSMTVTIDITANDAS